MAIGFQNGDIYLFNLLFNEVLLNFSHNQDTGSIKALSFSNDSSLGISLLASIIESKEGGKNVVFWDLNQKKIYSTLSNVHSNK